MAGRVAIDFGTARTKLAYLPAAGQRPELLRFVSDEGVERSFVPSLFYLPKGDEPPLVGDAAEAMLQEDPAGVIDDLKRRLREPRCRANGRQVVPEELLVLLFTDLRQRAAETIPAFGGLQPTTVSLTMPASFGPAQRDLMKSAARRAGFEEVEELIDEPVAAARGWLAEAQDRTDRLVVLDCGGGTVDWAYVRRDGTGPFRLVAACPPGGVDRLGGHDVDNGLVELVEHKLAEQGIESAEFAVTRRARLRARLRRVKETWARGRDTVMVPVGDAAVPIGREEIRTVIQSQFVTRAADGLRAYLGQIAGIEGGGEHPPVLLAGGSARLDGLREAVEALDCRALAWDRADFAACIGALTEELPVAGEAGMPPSRALAVTDPAVMPRTALVRVLEPRRPPGTVFREVDEPWCPEMVVLPRGEFWMGSPKGEAHREPCEGPRHRMRIDYDLAVGTGTVTFAEWDAWYRHVSDETGREDETTYRPSDEGWGRGDRPVINVSWDLVQDYLTWLNTKLGLTDERYSYRLLSEAEWEYACRGGTDTRFWSGDLLPEVLASKIHVFHSKSSDVLRSAVLGIPSALQNVTLNKARKLPEPARGGEKNAFGLCWVHGNVWEWVSDSYVDSYNDTPADGSPYLDGEPEMRVRRGGSFGLDWHRLRSAARSKAKRIYRGNTTGFRVSRRLP